MPKLARSLVIGVWLASPAVLGGCRQPPIQADPSSAEPRPGAEPEPEPQPEPEPEPEPRPEPEPEPTCNDEPCAAPRECLQYYGIAGPSGPSFQACEIRCDRVRDRDGAGNCPEGTRCVTIADGPGDVCR